MRSPTPADRASARRDLSELQEAVDVLTDSATVGWYMGAYLSGRITRLRNYVDGVPRP